MDTVLVTGGAGSIGSNLARVLLDRKYRVVILDDLSSGHRSLVDSRAVFVKGSISSEPDIAAVFNEHKPAYVFHLAALFANQNSVEHPGTDLITNGFGTVNVLDLSARSGVKKVLFVSSSCVYGNNPVMAENGPTDTFETPYALTKYLGEKYCHYWAAHHGLDVVIVRLFNSFGPGEYPGRYRNVIPNFFRLAMNGKPLPITGSGDETRDFNYVDNTVQGITGAMFSRTAPADTFNIGSGKESKIVTVATLINEIAGNRAGLEFKPRRGWDQVTNRVAVIAKAGEIFGYRPEISLEEGLQRTHAWLKDAPDMPALNA